MNQSSQNSVGFIIVRPLTPALTRQQSRLSEWGRSFMDNMIKIPLGQELFAIIDDDDFERVSKIKWRWIRPSKKSNLIYAIGAVDNKIVWMHQMIAGDGSAGEIDHKNGDGLDNRRNNLRPATHQQNTFNQKIQTRPGKSSKYKGVCLFKNLKYKKWNARIKLGGIQYSLGYFATQEDAALAYDKKAKELFGEFARTNFK